MDMTERTSVVFYVIVDHQHDFPLKHIVVHKPAADTRYIFVIAHLLKLPGELVCGG
jgi:hypothetical protein